MTPLEMVMDSYEELSCPICSLDDRSVSCSTDPRRAIAADNRPFRWSA
jgi:hypothetical protein